MQRKISFGLLWLGFIAYAFLFAPPNQPDTLELITNLSLGAWDGINPLIIALFNLMGIWPMIYACVVLIDGRGQKIKAGFFVLGSFALGAFALLPYLALREANPQFSGEKTLLLRILDSRVTGVCLTVAALSLVCFGLLYGNWADFIQQWQTSQFIHVMSLDFCLLSFLFPSLLKDDLARRGIDNQFVFWLVSLLPLFGPLLYLCWRPSVTSNAQPSLAT